MLKNQIKTFILLLVLTALILGIGSIFGRDGLIVAFLIVLLMNFFSYYFSDKIVLALYRAKEVKEGWLYNEVKELSKKAGLPMPRVYVSEFPVANAFATGRNPKNSAVVVTRKLLEMLNKDEIKGVLAHELSHIKNRDILISTIASVMAGIIMFIASMFRWSLFFGRSERENIASLIAIIIIAIIAPFAALLIQLAISRTREYLADETGARILGNGKPLARALIKLENQSKIPASKAIGFETTENLFIVNPFTKEGFMALFSTHPPTKERVRRLLSLKI